MADTRICPECEKTFSKDSFLAIWFDGRLYCSPRCRDDYVEHLTLTFHPLKHERDGYGS